MARKVACKSEALFPVITSLLEDGSDVKLTITGNSMFPLLRHKVDSVLLRQTSSLSDIFEGDIVLVQREVGRYVLHRVVAKQADRFSIAGDAQTWIEGPLQQDHLLGVVTSITRGKMDVTSDTLLWKATAYFYKRRTFIRKIFIKGIKFIFL